MMKIFPHFLLLSLMLIITGCGQSSIREQPHYYLLQSNSASYNKAATKIVIGLSPVSVADYINAPGVALLTRGNQIRIANYHLWAEQPDLAISRVLHSELDQLLQGIRVDNGQLGRQPDWDFTLATQIDQFHGSEQGDARLSGYWQLRSGEKVLLTQRFNLSQTLEEPGYPALVKSLRALLHQLALTQEKEISEVVRAK